MKVSSDVTQITFSWTAALDNGSPLTTYDVYWNSGSGTSYSLLSQNVGVVTQFTTQGVVADLTDGALYRFKVLPYNLVGAGDVSD